MKNNLIIERVSNGFLIHEDINDKRETYCFSEDTSEDALVDVLTHIANELNGGPVSNLKLEYLTD